MSRLSILPFRLLVLVLSLALVAAGMPWRTAAGNDVMADCTTVPLVEEDVCKDILCPCGDLGAGKPCDPKVGKASGQGVSNHTEQPLLGVPERPPRA